MRDTLLQNAASALYQSYRERFEVSDQQVRAVAECCRVNFLTIVVQIQSSDGLAVSSAVDIAGADGAATLNLLLRSSFNQSTMFSNDSIDALLWIQMGLECLDNAGCDCVIYAKSIRDVLIDLCLLCACSSANSTSSVCSVYRLHEQLLDSDPDRACGVNSFLLANSTSSFAEVLDCNSVYLLGPVLRLDPRQDCVW